MRAVRFDGYGGVEVLRVVDVDPPVPGADQVVVRVRAAGINPGEAKIRDGSLHEMWPTTFPCGEGTDFAGVVELVGSGVTDVAVGDEVAGWTDERGSHAELVAVPADQVVPKPADVPWEVAGALFVVGTTAVAAVRAVDAGPHEVVVVAGAGGGVGAVAAQLAVAAGSRVIGAAGERDHEWLREHGVEPVLYGDGLADRVRAMTDGVDAFIDTAGHGNVAVALELEVAPARIDTIVDFPAIREHGVQGDGSAQAATQDVLLDLVAAVADGRLDVPVDRVFSLDDVQDAYRYLAQKSGRGKVVLIP